MLLKQNQFTVIFWGVRGSIACPGTETVRYGGNTPCLEMRVGGHRLIFDGGTGLRVLGQSLLSQTPVNAHMLFTHTHWDHIQGFPFLHLPLLKIIVSIYMGQFLLMDLLFNKDLMTKCSTLISQYLCKLWVLNLNFLI